MVTVFVVIRAVRFGAVCRAGVVSVLLTVGVGSAAFAGALGATADVVWWCFPIVGVREARGGVCLCVGPCVTAAGVARGTTEAFIDPIRLAI